MKADLVIAVRTLLMMIAGGAPFPYPDNPNCIRAGLAYAFGAASAQGMVPGVISEHVLEYLTKASDEELLELAQQKFWEAN